MRDDSDVARTGMDRIDGRSIPRPRAIMFSAGASPRLQKKGGTHVFSRPRCQKKNNSQRF
jgi:hypothetical protein